MNYHGDIMTIGVYKLIFSDNSYYIGKSVNIEDRYYGHLSSLRHNKHHNILVQNKYHKYGIPTLKIIESTSVKDLTNIEAAYINNYINDDLNLNISIGGINENTGIDHGNSIYSEDQLIIAFKYLVDRKLSHQQIANITNVTIASIKALSSGKRHQWLKDRFPIEYNELLVSKRELFNSSTITNGDRSIIINRGQAAGVARELGIDASNLSKLIKGKIKNLKGWRLQ